MQFFRNYYRCCAGFQMLGLRLLKGAALGP
jgi:hypothetical protein